MTLPVLAMNRSLTSCQHRQRLSNVSEERRKQLWLKAWTLIVTRTKMSACILTTGLNHMMNRRINTSKAFQWSGIRRLRSRTLTLSASSSSSSVNTQDAPAPSRRVATCGITSGSTQARDPSAAPNAKKLLHRVVIWADI